MEVKQERVPLNDSSSGSDSEESFDEAGELPVSEIIVKSRVQFAIGATVAVAAVAAVYFLENRVVDVLSCLAAGYIYGVFCFQAIYVEWPMVPYNILLLLIMGLLAFLMPTLLNQPQVDAWSINAVKGSVWVLDVLLLLACYKMMVVGPSHGTLKKDSLKDKVYVITGCNTGIGYETARILAEAGAKIVFACRSEDRARAAMKSIVDQGKVDESQLVFVPLDTSNFASVRKFADLLEKTGLRPNNLIMNAGVMMSNRTLSKDGLELTMATNHFGHFLLTQQLLPSLMSAEARGEKPRIVVVGSNMLYMHDRLDYSELCVVPDGDEKAKQEFMQKPYAMFRAYGQSKLAQTLFTVELARRMKAQGSKIPVNQIHPGEVLTEVMRDFNPIITTLTSIFRPVALGMMKSPVQGAYCTLHVATHKQCATADQVSGRHFTHCHPTLLSRAASDEDAAARLWNLTEEITGQASLV